MSLNQAQQDQVWALFKDTPLLSKWPEFRERYLPYLQGWTAAANQTIFEPGYPPTFLYLVGEGTVIQSLEHDGRVWLQQRLGPGAFFGQQALFAEEYVSKARVAADGPATIFTLSAAELRVAMEHNAALYEELLAEQRAMRLRRIPLLRSLSHNEVRWLAQVVVEKEFRAGDSIPVDAMPGIWIIDWGQVSVSGPANPYPDLWGDWRLTAGGFFIADWTRASEPQAGQTSAAFSTAAQTASAHLKSRLFYIPSEHAQRLVAVFLDVEEMVRRRLLIADELSKAELFRSLSAEHRQHLAQFCAREFVPAKQNITTQGNVGHSYVILRDGSALVTALDDHGRERPRNRLNAPQHYGETSLLEGKPRDATVRAIQAEAPPGRDALAGADLIVLDRRDLRHAFRERPDLWTQDVELVTRSKRSQAKVKQYDWMQEGEVVLWYDRPHILWLLGPEILTLGVFLVVVALLLTFLPSAGGGGVITAVILASLIFLSVVAWFAYNYYDDYYVLTNRRVTRRDHQLLTYESRVEAPVEMIQDVTVDADLWGRIFEFGNVTIRTAARVGAIKFIRVPWPDEVKDKVNQERTEAMAAVRGRQKEEMRRLLISELNIALPIPQRSRALGEASLPLPGALRLAWLQRLIRPFVPRRTRKPAHLPTPLSPRSMLRRLMRGVLPETWLLRLFGPPIPPPRVIAGEVIWRRHWLNFLHRTGAPLIMLIVLLAVLIMYLMGVGAMKIDSSALNPTSFVLAWLFLALSVAFWLWYQATDYRNDMYIVTDDKIIDVEMKPLGLSAKRREGGLERVQNVVYVQKGIWANIFDYGDVVISTAAQDEGFTFLMVGNPKLVQATVFQKLDSFRNRQDKKSATERQQELIEGIEVYHQLQPRQPGTQLPR